MAAFIRGVRKHLFMGYSAAMLTVFFLIPFAIMIRMSFNYRVESGFYLPGWELTHYARFFSPLFTTHLWVSVEFSTITAALAVLIAFPFTYFLSRYRRSIQVVALVFVLGLIGAIAWTARRFGLLRGAVRPRNGVRRLEVIETAAVDSKRRLMLVRRDRTEHLLLLGIGGDMVIERDIAPAAEPAPPPTMAGE